MNPTPKHDSTPPWASNFPESRWEVQENDIHLPLVAFGLQSSAWRDRRFAERVRPSHFRFTTNTTAIHYLLDGRST
jgi:hypothetical protein